MILSVVMSVYNGEKHVKKAIDSILNQSYRDFEFIIINDGSTDSTAEILAHYSDNRIKLITQQNSGLSKSLNNGIALAQGHYIARIDADDMASPKRFEKQLLFLKNNPDIVLLGTNANIVDDEGNFLYTSQVENSIDSADIFKTTNPFFHSSVIFKKAIFDQCGGYNEEVIHHFEDMLLWAKMFNYGKLANLDEALIDYRITPNGISNKSKKGFVLQKKISSAYLKGEHINATDLNRFLAINKVSNSKKKALYHNRIAKIFLTIHGDKKSAFKNIMLSFKNLPFNFGALKLMAYLFFMSKAPKNQNIQ